MDFLQDYENGTYSVFLMQSILASMVSYAPLELINEAGYDNHFAAQSAFFERAQLLCDLGAETSQLRLLQGSIALSTLHFSFATDKDYRFWLSNAVRIATLLGLHKDAVSEGVNSSTKRLFRRIWWLLYNRDSLLVTIGVDNVRRIHDNDFDTRDITEEDFSCENIPQRFLHVIRPTAKLQHLFFMESCKLSRLSKSFLHVFVQIWSNYSNKVPFFFVLPRQKHSKNRTWLIRPFKALYPAGSEPFPKICDSRITMTSTWTTFGRWCWLRGAICCHV